MSATRVRIAEGVLSSPVAREAVLLELESGRYFGLNEVGAKVWRLLSEGAELEAVVAAVATEYEVDEAMVRRDLDRLLDQLVEAGLVRLETGPSRREG
jgi:hypothetical protein